MNNWQRLLLLAKLSIFYKSQAKELGVTNTIEAYIHSFVLISREGISLEYRSSIEDVTDKEGVTEEVKKKLCASNWMRSRQGTKKRNQLSPPPESLVIRLAKLNKSVNKI